MARLPLVRRCAGCGADSLHHYYRVSTLSGTDVKCFRCALRHRPMVANSLQTAAVVGTILTANNQGDVLLQGALTPGVLGKMVLTYLVPYLVSCNAALVASRVGPVDA